MYEHHDAGCGERSDIFAAGGGMRGPAGVPVGAIRRVILSNITCLNTGTRRIASILAGIPGHPIEDVKISDIMIVHPGGGTNGDAALQLAEKEKDYPEPNMFGTTSAHGFFVRHVRRDWRCSDARLNMRVRMRVRRLRSRMWRTRSLGGCKACGERWGCRRFRFAGVREFSVYRSKPVKDAELCGWRRRRFDFGKSQNPRTIAPTTRDRDGAPFGD